MAFDLISSEYGWDDEVILDKTLRRIRQILAAITLRRKERIRQERLIVSWQTRSLAMVMAGSGGNANESIMKFASTLTIDNDEYREFNNEQPIESRAPKLPVHASTQDEATEANYAKAADRNSFEMLEMMALGMSRAAPGQ